MPAVALSHVGARVSRIRFRRPGPWPPGRGSGWKARLTRAHRKGGSTRWRGTAANQHARKQEGQMCIRDVQDAARANKHAKGFKTSDVLEFCLMADEASEAFTA